MQGQIMMEAERGERQHRVELMDPAGRSCLDRAAMVRKAGLTTLAGITLPVFSCQGLFWHIPAGLRSCVKSQPGHTVALSPSAYAPHLTTKGRTVRSQLIYLDGGQRRRFYMCFVLSYALARHVRSCYYHAVCDHVTSEEIAACMVWLRSTSYRLPGCNKNGIRPGCFVGPSDPEYGRAVGSG